MEVYLTTKLSEKELSKMAGVYRSMATQARDPRLTVEFNERAEKFETAAWAVQRVRKTGGASDAH
jgi:hypothetical protein